VPTFTNVKGADPGDFIGGMGGVRRAAGGPIYGAGTATSDSIPAMLSNGEHVLTAAEVAAAGGHGAIYALRKAILTGGVQYRASGGPASASAYRSAPPSPMRIDLGRLAETRAGDTFNVTTGDPVRAARMVSDERDWKAVNGF
jgi:hypothetical protein